MELKQVDQNVNESLVKKLSEAISKLMECNQSSLAMNDQILIKEAINLCDEVCKNLEVVSEPSVQEDALPILSSSSGLDKKKVMVVDDDLVLLKILKTRLSRKGLVVEIFNNPEKALTSLNDFDPDIIVLDLMMPELTGFEFIQRVGSKYPGHKYKIIVGTGRQYVKDRLNSLEMGADDFLDKPYDISELYLRIKKILK